MRPGYVVPNPIAVKTLRVAILSTDLIPLTGLNKIDRRRVNPVN
jgi:hypothetical protein